MLILFLLLSIVSVACAEEVKFNDISKENWYFEDVMSMAGKGYVKGYDDNTFRPNDMITNAEFISILLRSVNNDGNVTVVSGHWAATAVNKADEIGWFDETLPYDVAITRELSAKILMRAIKEPLGDILCYEKLIKDGKEISPDCLDFVLAAYSKGIITGDEKGNFVPKNTLSRAEACAIISRAVINTNKRIDTPTIKSDTQKLKVKEIYAGFYANYMIDENNVLWGYGSNKSGNLGIGKKTSYEILPLKIAEDVKFMSAGISHNFIIKSSGELWGWGGNYTGQLVIDGDEKVFYEPVKIMDNVKYALALEGNSVIIKENGDLWVYGPFSETEMKDTYDNKIMPKPRLITGNVKKAGYIRAEGGTIAILKENNELWYWDRPYNADEAESLKKALDNIVDIYAFMDLFAKDVNGQMWALTSTRGFGENYYGSVQKPTKLEEKIKTIGLGMIGYLFIDEKDIAYSEGLKNKGEDFKHGEKYYEIMTDAQKVSFGWSQGLILNNNGEVYGVGTTWSGNYNENSWDRNNRTPINIFLRKK